MSVSPGVPTFQIDFYLLSCGNFTEIVNVISLDHTTDHNQALAYDERERERGREREGEGGGGGGSERADKIVSRFATELRHLLHFALTNFDHSPSC